MSDRSDDRQGPTNGVLIPGGRRHLADVKEVEAEHLVRVGPRGRMRVGRKREISHAEARALAERNLQVAPGGFRDPRLVREVQSGERIAASAEVTPLTEGRDAAGPAVPISESGWIANAFWENSTGTPLQEFRTRWRVPPPPRTPTQQTIFLFNGLQDRSGDKILQPVLQWGLAAAMGGGEFWAIASWFVEANGRAYHTPVVRVEPGDELVGVMRLFGQDGSGFSYLCDFEGRVGTALEVAGVPELVWAYEALEAYAVDACEDYPDTNRTELDNIVLRTGTPLSTVGWGTEILVAGCGRSVDVVDDSASGGKIDIWYR